MNVQGDEPGEIAAKPHLPNGTVRNYLTTTVVKLNARNRIDAVRMATEAGWLLRVAGPATGPRPVVHRGARKCRHTAR